MVRLCLSAFVLALMALPTVSAAEYVKIVHVETGKVLSVADDSEEDSAEIVLAAEGESQSQQWEIVKDGDYLKIVNRKSGKVLDVSGDSKDEDGQIIQYGSKEDGADNQRWSWDGKEKEKGNRLKSKSSELVLVANGDGKIVQKKLDAESKAQLWTVKKVKE
jgi:galactan endo-1,6-beta-galactosidase